MVFFQFRMILIDLGQQKVVRTLLSVLTKHDLFSALVYYPEAKKLLFERAQELLNKDKKKQSVFFIYCQFYRTLFKCLSNGSNGQFRLSHNNEVTKTGSRVGTKSVNAAKMVCVSSSEKVLRDQLFLFVLLVLLSLFLALGADFGKRHRTH